jgi:CO/xanthine dehydrogenase Mo-binding subunit
MLMKIGESQLRHEDDALLRGAGQFTGDELAEDELAMAVVRSPFGAGRIRGADTEAARAVVGVVAVLDYAMPRAADLPGLDVSSHAVPTTKNALGAKGAGEAGVVGALAAGINAVCDALGPLGVSHIDMPATPQRIWRAINDAQRAS